MSSKMSSSDMPKSDHVLTEQNYSPNNESFRIFPSCPEDEIVISGIAGRYPSCDNVDEFRHHLYNKVRFSGVFFFARCYKLNRVKCKKMKKMKKAKNFFNNSKMTKDDQ